MTYNGGKNGSGTYQKIINLIPPHDIYLELFFGSGAIYFNKMPAKTSFLMDMDPHLVASMKNQIGAMDNIVCSDAISFLETSSHILNFLVTAGHKLFMYLDPPYPFCVRRSEKKLYKHELNDEDHNRLLLAASSCKFPVMISSYRNEMYDRYLSNWNTLEYQAMSRCGTRTEIVYFNYPVPAVLHDYKFIGKDFREREKYKLIRENVVSKLNQLPDQLRNAILNDMISKVK
jgi:DNA adenine methylase